MPKSENLFKEAVHAFLRLNCLTEAYAPLWNSVIDEEWTHESPLRKSLERQLAQIRIDVIVAIHLNISADELCAVYRTQFPVMRKYDVASYYDGNGRAVPVEISENSAKSDSGVENMSQTWIPPESGENYEMQLPFHRLDREMEIQHQYHEITKMLGTDQP